MTKPVEVNLEQGSVEWRAWRQLHRMASETPGVMGLSPYMTPNDVRNAKRGVQQYVNAAMRRGTEQEPIARAAYEAAHEMMRPAVYELDDYGASLDGINLTGDLILEVKTPADCSTSDRWKLAKQGRVTEYDMAQVQHQLMVVEAKRAHVWIWDADGQRGELVELEPSEQWRSDICTAWDAFWPSLGERRDEAFIIAAARFREANAVLKEAERLATEAKQAVIELLQGDFNVGGGVRVQRIQRAGQIDWKRVQTQHLNGIDIEPYRKPGTEYVTVQEAE